MRSRLVEVLLSSGLVPSQAIERLKNEGRLSPQEALQFGSVPLRDLDDVIEDLEDALRQTPEVVTFDPIERGLRAEVVHPEFFKGVDAARLLKGTIFVKCPGGFTVEDIWKHWDYRVGVIVLGRRSEHPVRDADIVVDAQGHHWIKASLET
jgi:hypothetical protein